MNPQQSGDMSVFFSGFLAQTSKIAEELIRICSIPKERIHLLPPAIPDLGKQERKKKVSDSEKFKICYSGKIAAQWGVLELIDAVVRIGYQDKVEVHIIGDKIHDEEVGGRSLRDLISEANSVYEFVTMHGGLSREEAIRIVSTMDLAWAYRNPLFELQTMELSTKLLEYLSVGVPVILSRSELNEGIVGSDYPLLISSKDEIDDVLYQVIQQEGIGIESESLRGLSAEYSFENLRKRLIEPIIEGIEAEFVPNNRRIVVNGHDFKFIAEYESDLKRKGHQVRRDKWGWSDPIDLRRSEALVEWGETIVSEWGLMNSVWYSENCCTGGKQHFVRVHLQEISERAAKYTSQIIIEGVNRFVFVANHVAEKALSKYNWPREKIEILPNYVDLERFSIGGNSKGGKTIGIVGIVPKRKRLDIALDVIKKLNELDSGWKLVIKGRMPSEYPFMRAPNRSQEMAYFNRQLKRINVDSILKSSVDIIEYSPTISEFYNDIDFILSPSDFESFHFSVAEGAASGSFPVVWNWTGAEDIYPQKWIVNNTAEAVDRILTKASDRNNDSELKETRKYIEERFAMSQIFQKLDEAFDISSARY